MKYAHRFPAKVIERDGPFKEFAQWASIVTVETSEGSVFSPVLLVAPDSIAAMPDAEDLPFSPSSVAKIYQTPDNLNTISSSDWSFYTEGKKELDFESLPQEEKIWYTQDTWCDSCNKADLGITEPLMYKEGGITYVAGMCKECGSECKTTIYTKLVE